MSTCIVCALPAEPDLALGTPLHPACLAERVPQDAVVALVASIVLVLAPAVVVWAG